MTTEATAAAARKLVRKKAKVLFEYRGDVESGDVIDVEVRGDKKHVTLVWLDGHSTRTDDAALDDLLAVADHGADEICLSSFVGRGHLLPAGLSWREAHA